MARYGGKGYTRVFVTIYGKLNNSPYSKLSLNYEADYGIAILPLSTYRSGIYNQSRGHGESTAERGFYAISYIHSNSNIRYLNFHTNVFNTNSNNAKGHGYSVRCVAKRGDATDSICPKGWEMARYSGDGSWSNLMITIYGRDDKSKIMFNSHFIISNYKAYNGIIHFPISILLNGSANLTNRGSYGYYFTSKIGASDAAKSLWFHSDGMLISNGQVKKGNYHSLRCVANLSQTVSLCYNNFNRKGH